MNDLNTTTYIKKLVKIIYEKEKQIEQLKNITTTKHSIDLHSEEELPIDPHLKQQLELTSQQLKCVNRQVLTMQGKMVELSAGLTQEIQKNAKLEQEINTLKKTQKQMVEELQHKSYQLKNSKSMIETLNRNIVEIGQKLSEITLQNRTLREELDRLREERAKQRQEKVQLDNQLRHCRNELNNKQKELKQLATQILQKSRNFQQLTQTNLKEYEQTRGRIAELTRKIVQLQSQNDSLNEQIQTSNSNYKMKENELLLLSQKLKDYEEFAFEIAHHLESSYLKHICKGSLRSSKKLNRENDNYKSKFEAAYSKMSQLQLWMDSTADKLQKIMKEQQIPCGTLENLSLIAHSFEEKLELCDLTERIQKERMENEINQEMLLNNLQKECEKSYERQRSKVVELGELKQILKMTKDVNRELMDEVNKKEHIINQCKKTLLQLMGSKASPQYKAIKSLLGLSN